MLKHVRAFNSHSLTTCVSRFLQRCGPTIWIEGRLRSTGVRTTTRFRPTLQSSSTQCPTYSSLSCHPCLFICTTRMPNPSGPESTSFGSFSWSWAWAPPTSTPPCRSSDSFWTRRPFCGSSWPDLRCGTRRMRCRSRSGTETAGKRFRRQWVGSTGVWSWYSNTFCLQILVLTIATTYLAFLKPSINAFCLMTLGIPSMFLLAYNLKREEEERVTNLGKRSIIYWVLSVTCWLSDKLYCDLWSNLGFPYLHGFWHVLIFLASYTAVVLFAYFDVKNNFPHERPMIRYWPADFEYGISYVQLKSYRLNGKDQKIWTLSLSDWISHTHSCSRMFVGPLLKHCSLSPSRSCLFKKAFYKPLRWFIHSYI